MKLIILCIIGFVGSIYGAYIYKHHLDNSGAPMLILACIYNIAEGLCTIYRIITT